MLDSALNQNQVIQGNNSTNTLEPSKFPQQINNSYNNTTTESQQQFSIVDNLIKDGDKYIKELFPENAYGMFNKPADMNKYNQDTLRVDFKLTQEICDAMHEAISSKNFKALKLKNLILNPDDKYLGEYKNILSKQIEHMLSKFTSIKDLDFITNYLKITGGKPIYTTASSMQNWLNSLKFINEIKEVATPFLEEIIDNTASQSYELRVSLYFRTNNNSEIVIPKSEQLPLLTQLKQIENNIQEILNRQMTQLQSYTNEITAINLNKEIQKLKQDENIIKLENINTNIDKKSKENNEIINERDQELKKTRNNTAKNNIRNKYNPKINKINDELKSLQEEKTRLEQEFEPLVKQIKEKEEQYQQMKKSYERTISFVEVTIEQFNNEIKKQLEIAKSLFDSNKKNINNNIA